MKDRMLAGAAFRPDDPDLSADGDRAARLLARYDEELDREVRWGEWVHSRARRSLLVEEHLGEDLADLADHESLVFDGRVRLVQVDAGRHGTGVACTPRTGTRRRWSSRTRGWGR